MRDEEWRSAAACREADLELFYSERESDEQEALAYCDRCPVLETCRAVALTDREEHGVWGGTTGAERRRIFRRERRRRAAARRIEAA